MRELSFERILDEVASGRADAGVLIHEGQLTYGASGLHKVLDLGEWWTGETGLPLPLGVNVARRDLGDRLPDVSAVLGEAIRVGLEHRDEALAYAEGFGRGIDRETADRFVAMYVNDLTCDFGETGRAAVDELLRRSGSGRHRGLRLTAASRYRWAVLAAGTFGQTSYVSLLLGLSVLAPALRRRSISPGPGRPRARGAVARVDRHAVRVGARDRPVR